MNTMREQGPDIGCKCRHASNPRARGTRSCRLPDRPGKGLVLLHRPSTRPPAPRHLAHRSFLACLCPGLVCGCLRGKRAHALPVLRVPSRRRPLLRMLSESLFPVPSISWKNAGAARRETSSAGRRDPRSPRAVIAVLAARGNGTGVIVLLFQTVVVLFLTSMISCPSCRQRDVCSLARLAVAGSDGTIFDREQADLVALPSSSQSFTKSFVGNIHHAPGYWYLYFNFSLRYGVSEQKKRGQRLRAPAETAVSFSPLRRERSRT